MLKDLYDIYDTYTDKVVRGGQTLTAIASYLKIAYSTACKYKNTKELVKDRYRIVQQERKRSNSTNPFSPSMTHVEFLRVWKDEWDCIHKAAKLLKEGKGEIITCEDGIKRVVPY